MISLHPVDVLFGRCRYSTQLAVVLKVGDFDEATHRIARRTKGALKIPGFVVWIGVDSLSSPECSGAVDALTMRE